jgi:hypothetical protein
MQSRIARGSMALAISIALCACGGDEQVSPAPTTTPQAPEGPPEPACGDPAAAREVAEDPSFELRASAAGPYAPGQEGRFELTLTPRANYHVNTQYPLAIRLAGPTDVAFARAELGTADAAEYVEPRARVPVTFTPTAAGQHRVTAEVDFAVCTPESCMPECRTLALVLPVETGAAPGAGSPAAAGDPAAVGVGDPAVTATQ